MNDLDQARAAIDQAIRDYKLVPALRGHFASMAETHPDLFRSWLGQIAESPPPYVDAAEVASARLSLRQARLAEGRRRGKRADATIELAALIADMHRFVLSIPPLIEAGALPPAWAVEHDRWLAEARRISSRLSKVRVDPSAKGQGGRHRVDGDSARERLFKRMDGWTALHPAEIEDPTDTALAKISPKCDRGTVADDRKRAGDWSIADLQREHRTHRRRTKATR